MDQDIHFQHATLFNSITSYFIVPYRCTLRAIAGIVQADPGDADTCTVTHEPTVGGASTALGTLTFGTDIAAGAVGVWAAHADGGKVMEAGSFIKFVTSAATSVVLNMDIELDPYAR